MPTYDVAVEVFKVVTVDAKNARHAKRIVELPDNWEMVEEEDMLYWVVTRVQPVRKRRRRR